MPMRAHIHEPSRVNSPPKQGQKRGQSNTEAKKSKCVKANTKSDGEESNEGEPEVGKGKGKTGGKKGKKASVEQALEASGTSVAPPKCTGHSSTSSFLPPAPTVSSSRSRINREPAVTAAHEETSDEKSDEEDGDEGSDGDERGEEQEVIRFGPPRGHRQAKSGSNHHEPLAEALDFNLAIDLVKSSFIGICYLFRAMSFSKYSIQHI
ncbi:uncharacterized protein LACBIDRAFT_331912 [Laccaria bicolor S238N-H82]|uniref:Predicted protein n=1 Tax=Laccaria bicolor (strain S238N-H82 / ATCC MYA-4686) TaxID=486041 RepID=B0DR10_LACBS|nr:uncharacterized protein LACBIDRAFT_331912 [Laccaria bicolor S238N-H82]EDR02917.1 predicted protein [Laccaria bicolor S238N-H82]|eukprot:XP_001886340.1 predicted protein [Laccaria bicolor S238N-H82]